MPICQHIRNGAQVVREQTESVAREAVKGKPESGCGHQKQWQFVPLPVGEQSNIPIFLLDVRVVSGQKQVGEGETGRSNDFFTRQKYWLKSPINFII